MYPGPLLRDQGATAPGRAAAARPIPDVERGSSPALVPEFGLSGAFLVIVDRYLAVDEVAVHDLAHADAVHSHEGLLAAGQAPAAALATGVTG